MRSGKDAIKVCRRFSLHKINKNIQKGAKFRAHLPFNASLFRLYAGKLSLRTFWWSSNVFFIWIINCLLYWLTLSNFCKTKTSLQASLRQNWNIEISTFFVWVIFILRIIICKPARYRNTNLLNPLSTNVPLIDKPGSWFLLGKCMKNTCKRVTF